MTEIDGAGLVSPSDIAEVAGVSRGAVSNWRKRQDDFPQSVSGTTTKPLFSRSDVMAWLAGRGYTVKRDDGQARLWAAMNNLRGEMHPEETAAVVVSLACAWKLAREFESVGDTPWDDIRTAALSADLGDVDGVVRRAASQDARWGQLVDIPWQTASARGEGIAQLIDAIESIEPDELAGVIDYVLGRTATAAIRSGGEHGFVGSRISTLLGRLAAMGDADVLYDPACGVASALTASLDAGVRPLRVVGHEINENTVRTAAQRLFLRGVDGDLVCTDVLALDVDPSLRADVIIVEPPFGLRWDVAQALTDARWGFGAPPRSSADLAWVQHAVAHLAPGGRAYVVTPMGALFRGGQERRIRSELVRAGCVRAVVALPGKMLPHVSIPLAVWVLGTGDSSQRAAEVLFVDASQATEPETTVPAWLHAAQGATPDGIAHRLVPIAEVIDDEANLSPARWTVDPEPDPDDVARRYVENWSMMTHTVDSLTTNLRALKTVPTVAAPTVVTVGQLVDQGILQIIPGRHREPDGLDESARGRLVTISSVRRAELPNVAVPDDRERDELRLTAGSGVLVTTTNGVRAVEEGAGGGYLLSAGVSEVRILNTNVITAGYLALVLTGSWNERFQSGTTIQRAAIRDLEIPLLSGAEQHEVELGGSTLDRIAHDADLLARHAAQLRSNLLDAVRFDASLQLPSTDSAPLDRRS